jgi:hypothetical protein
MTIADFKLRAGATEAEGIEDLTMTLHGEIFGRDVKTVRLPPDLGGRRVNVRECRAQDCPMCGQSHTMLVTDAPTTDGHVGVIEAKCQGTFAWVNVPA